MSSSAEPLVGADALLDDSSIGRLPPEILCGIFRLPAHDEARCAIWFALVCRRWRAIALADQHLWTLIDLSAPRTAALFLKRSGLLPVTVVLSISRGNEDRADLRRSLRLLKPHSDRVRAIALQGPVQYPTQFIDHFIGPSSILSSLKIHVQRQNPLYLDGAAAAKLQVLDLSNCNISWNTALFAHLRELSVSVVKDNSRSSALVWLERIRGLKLLEVINLTFVLPLSPLPAPSERVRLPRLRSFSMTDRMSGIAFLLRHLIIPEEAHISICTSDDISAQDSELCDALVAVIRTGADGPITMSSAFVRIDAAGAFLSAYLTTTFDPARTARRRLHFRYGCGGLRGAEALNALHPLFVAAEVQDLQLTCNNHSITSDEWVNMLVPLRLLRVLCMQGYANASSLLEALGGGGLQVQKYPDTIENDVVVDGSQLPLPHLETLQLRGSGATFERRVLHMLRARARGGLPERIQMVNVVTSYPWDPQALHELQKLVGDVHITDSVGFPSH